VQLSIQVFWDVMLHCWVFLQWYSWGGKSSWMWCCVAGWVLLQRCSWGFRSSGMWCCNAGCFYSGVVEDSGLLGCDTALLDECFYSNVAEDSGVLECDAMLHDGKHQSRGTM
jgi:hypothetical protein